MLMYYRYVIIKFSIKVMIRMKSPIKAPKGQKGKMKTLLDCFQENPYS